MCYTVSFKIETSNDTNAHNILKFHASLDHVDRMHTLNTISHVLDSIYLCLKFF
uniref:Uncharacterized protein n=1 Tax=Arundo donax TaxID=35708 RepID=A0A0A9BW90_ARUDO